MNRLKGRSWPPTPPFLVVTWVTIWAVSTDYQSQAFVLQVCTPAFWIQLRADYCPELVQWSFPQISCRCNQEWGCSFELKKSMSRLSEKHSFYGLLGSCKADTTEPPRSHEVATSTSGLLPCYVTVVVGKHPTFYIHACCGLRENPHLSAKVYIVAPSNIKQGYVGFGVCVCVFTVSQNETSRPVDSFCLFVCEIWFAQGPNPPF